MPELELKPAFLVHCSLFFNNMVTVFLSYRDQRPTKQSHLETHMQKTYTPKLRALVNLVVSYLVYIEFATWMWNYNYSNILYNYTRKDWLPVWFFSSFRKQVLRIYASTAEDTKMTKTWFLITRHLQSRWTRKVLRKKEL